MRITVLLLAILLLPTASSAQVILGVVRDEGETAVQNAAVALLDRAGTVRRETATDSAGLFRLNVESAGNYVLRVTRIGFTDYSSESVAVGAVETVTVEITLGLAAVPLDPIRVTARHSDPRLAAFHQRRLSRAAGRFLTRSEIEGRSQARTTDVLRGIPGINIVSVRSRGTGGRTANLVSIRGGGSICEPAMFIDGMRARQHPMSTMDDILSPSAIEGVEIYTATAAAPVQYAGDGGCGVILFWTRSGAGSEGTRLGWLRAIAVAGGALVLFAVIR